MNRTLLAILVSLSLVTMISARFSCGHDPIQSGFAELLVKNDCKGRMSKLGGSDVFWKTKQLQTKLIPAVLNTPPVTPRRLQEMFVMKLSANARRMLLRICHSAMYVYIISRKLRTEVGS